MTPIWGAVPAAPLVGANATLPAGRFPGPDCERAMELESVERAIRRAHKRAEHEARQLAMAESAKAERRHERRLMQLRKAERDAILTYEMFDYDLEPCDLPEAAWAQIESDKRRAA